MVILLLNVLIGNLCIYRFKNFPALTSVRDGKEKGRKDAGEKQREEMRKKKRSISYSTSYLPPLSVYPLIRRWNIANKMRRIYFTHKKSYVSPVLAHLDILSLFASWKNHVTNGKRLHVLKYSQKSCILFISIIILLPSVTTFPSICQR